MTDHVHFIMEKLQTRRRKLQFSLGQVRSSAGKAPFGLDGKVRSERRKVRGALGKERSSRKEGAIKMREGSYLKSCASLSLSTISNILEREVPPSHHGSETVEAGIACYICFHAFPG